MIRLDYILSSTCMWNVDSVFSQRKLKYATYFCFRNFLLPKSFDVNVRVAETLRSRQKAFYQNNAIIKVVGEVIIYARMIWILKLAVDESSVRACS